MIIHDHRQHKSSESPTGGLSSTISLVTTKPCDVGRDENIKNTKVYLVG